MKYHPYRWSRRDFLKVMGLTTAGVFIHSNFLARTLQAPSTSSTATVAVTQHDDYAPSFIKEKVGYLFDQLGGIGDVAGTGDRVAVKINLTGGASWANHSNLQGVDIRDCAWTHPSVVRAVGELLIDYGVSPSDIYFVEALWDYNCYNDFGYLDVQNDLGAQLVNLNQPAPYPGFANISTGNDPYYYSYFIMNQILGEVDCFISLPKMKHHYDAGTTQSMKNSVGTVPLEFYQIPGMGGIRSAIHQEGGAVGYHLPRSICDLNMARPVNLAVIDGVKNAVGGEGPWNPTFTPSTYDFLLAGKDPVATDSIATLIMGLNPETEQLDLPSGLMSDNHLWLAKQKGMGTNILQEIELVGDGAAAVLGVDDHGGLPGRDAGLKIFPNYPNPFKDFTSVKFYTKSNGLAHLDVVDVKGRHITSLVDGHLDSGDHVTSWYPQGQSPGVYFLRLTLNNESVTRSVIMR